MPRRARTAETILLHLVPGLSIFLFYIAAAPFLIESGLPRVSALLLAFVAVGMPLQLGIMKSRATADGAASIAEIIGFREPMPWWLGVVLVAGSFALSIAMLATLPFERTAAALAENAFWWLPDVARPTNVPMGIGALVLATLVLQVLIDGIANPVVEEIYFRGFLLPRLAHLGWLAPVVNTALFAAAHFWQPYNYASIFLLVLPLTLITWWRRNFYVQMAAHCLANTIGAVLSLAGYAQAGG